jgi:hypothetical protein
MDIRYLLQMKKPAEPLKQNRVQRGAVLAQLQAGDGRQLEARPTACGPQFPVSGEGHCAKDQLDRVWGEGWWEQPCAKCVGCVVVKQYPKDWAETQTSSCHLWAIRGKAHQHQHLQSLGDPDLPCVATGQ